MGAAVNAREAALQEALALMRRHALTLEELRDALAAPAESSSAEVEPSASAQSTAHEQPPERAVSTVLPRVFAYIGGVFIFIGLVTFVSMRWNSLDAFGRVLITLGSGFCVFISALCCCFDARAARAATPLFIIAALLQPTGILVALEEYGRGGDPVLGLLFMYALMFIQQGGAFVRLQRTVLASTALVFGLGFCALAMDKLDVPPRLLGMTLGLSLVCIGWGANQSRHAVLAPWCYVFGAMAFLFISHDWLDDSAWEGVFPGLAAATIYLSTVARSRALLTVGTLALCAYLADFMWEKFADNLNAPLILILLGFMLIALGIMAVKINKRFISQAAAG
jgi:uncharacterized membrane protein